MLYAFYHRRRLAAVWLALLATLMIYLAPLVSRHLQAHPVSALHAQSVVNTQGDYEHPGHEEQASTDHHIDHDACGYCTLLGQLSWLTLSSPWLPVAMALWRFRAARPSGLRFRPSWPPFLARAPPQH